MTKIAYLFDSSSYLLFLIRNLDDRKGIKYAKRNMTIKLIHNYNIINYMKNLLYKLFVFLNNRLSIFEKIIYFILVTSLIIVTVISWIQTNPYYFALAIGLILFLTGIYLFIVRDFGKKQQVINRKGRKNYDKNSNNIRNIRNISTNGGNYNESIKGDYIQGDYINIQNQLIDISEDFTQILEKLQTILITLISQGSSREEAVNQIANDLAKESRIHPEMIGFGKLPCLPCLPTGRRISRQLKLFPVPCSLPSQTSYSASPTYLLRNV